MGVRSSHGDKNANIYAVRTNERICRKDAAKTFFQKRIRVYMNFYTYKKIAPQGKLYRNRKYELYMAKKKFIGGNSCKGNR